MTDLLLTETADRVRTITLNRPEARNALNSALQRATAAALTAAETDDAVDVVILTGADPAFCAGLDLKELGGSAENLRDVLDPGDSPFTVLVRMTKPVIGAVNGPCVTGGFELALACDFLVASERAAFADTHARVGLTPGGGMSVNLPQAVGLRKAKEMSLTGNYIDAAEAHRLGLVNVVVAHADLLQRAGAARPRHRGQRPARGAQPQAALRRGQPSSRSAMPGDSSTNASATWTFDPGRDRTPPRRHRRPGAGARPAT